MATDEQPNWQPISQLPLIGGMIRGMLAEGEDQYQTLLEARPKPHVLDDSIINRVVEVFGVQKDDLWLFEEQLARWQNETLTAGQRQEVDELSGALVRVRGVLDSILSLAEELGRGTIDKVMARSDLELGIEAVLRMQGQDGRRPHEGEGLPPRR